MKVGAAVGAACVALTLSIGCDGERRPEEVAATDSGSPPVATCPAPAAPDAGVPSFEVDVFPLLNGSCGSLGCHNDAYRNRGLFLGESPDEGTPDAASRAEAYATLLAPSETAPSLRRVEPGDPERSFLMLKIDGCHASVGLDCPTSPPERPCGERMPASSDPWPVDRRDTVRSWIAHGAPGP